MDAISEGQHLDAAYLIKHADSLVGKEVRIWAQAAAGFLAPMVQTGQVSKTLWRLWFWIGQMLRLLLIEGVPELKKQQYLVSFWCIFCYSSLTVLHRMMSAMLPFTLLRQLFTLLRAGLCRRPSSICFWPMLWKTSSASPSPRTIMKSLLSLTTQSSATRASTPTVRLPHVIAAGSLRPWSSFVTLSLVATTTPTHVGLGCKQALVLFSLLETPKHSRSSITSGPAKKIQLLVCLS